MVATMKVYLFVCFLVLVVGVYLQRVLLRDGQDYFQGVPRASYDDFLLVLQWPPSFCTTIDHDNNCREEVKHLGNFTIHGLWPQKNKSGVDCSNKTGPAFSIVKIRNLIKPLNKCWPDLKRKDSQYFWGSQWNKHGKCIDMDQLTYFNIAVDAYDGKNIDSLAAKLATLGIRKGKSYGITDYRKAIRKTLGVIPSFQCNNRSYNIDDKQLVEIKICVNKEGEFKDCKPSTEGECRFSSLIAFPE